jgi:hypothetical protein
LSAGEFSEIEAAASSIQVQGGRSSDAIKQMTKLWRLQAYGSHRKD